LKACETERVDYARFDEQRLFVGESVAEDFDPDVEAGVVDRLDLCQLGTRA
jgi:hypothetical protein